MIRFVFRLMSLVALVLAVAAGTLDSIQSVSASQVVLTSLDTAWTEMAPDSLPAMQQVAEVYLHPWVSEKVGLWLLPQPAFAAFLVLSLLFWMIGYVRPNPAGRFAA